jgi:hypothetical protein
MPNLAGRTLDRAAAIVGGMEALAVELGIPVEILSKYLRGELPIPTGVFLRASEIVTDATVVDAAKPNPPDKSPAA